MQSYERPAKIIQLNSTLEIIGIFDKTYDFQDSNMVYSSSDGTCFFRSLNFIRFHHLRLLVVVKITLL